MVKISKAEKARVREKLLESAAEHFADLGFDRASIDQIALDAGYAKGTIYNYFESKHQLMLTLLESAAESHFAHVSGPVLQESDPERRLNRFFTAAFTFVEEHLAESRVMFNTIHGPHADFKEHLYRLYRPMFDLVGREILAAGMERGVFQLTEQESTSHMVMTILLGTASLVDENGNHFLKADQVADFVGRALR